MIIGIGGVSRSGKTTLALRKKAELEALHPGTKAHVIHQDDYVQPVERIPMIRDRTDWECPESMDFERLYAAITDARSRYDWVIAEGILIFYDPKVNALFDERITLHIDRDTFMARRAQETRWGPEPEWYLEHVWNSHLVFSGIIE
jgi:nicotinamide/nicotinate riboside kinase